MESHIKTTESNIITIEDLKPLRDMIAKGATDAELQYFATYTNRVGLDPIQKQIHFVKRQTKNGPALTFQTGIDGFRLIAERSGVYAGSDDYLFNSGLSEFQMREDKKAQPITATVTVYKVVQGLRCPFTATVAWSEYYPGDAQGFMWKKMPFNQLGKCAEAKALRKAFPNLAGLYTDDEMAQADKAVEIKEVEDTEETSYEVMPKTAPKAPASKSDPLEIIKGATSIELKGIFDENPDLQSDKDFMQALKKRKEILEAEKSKKPSTDFDKLLEEASKLETQMRVELFKKKVDDLVKSKQIEMTQDQNNELKQAIADVSESFQPTSDEMSQEEANSFVDSL